MKNSEFNAYKSNFRSTFRKVLASAPARSLDEAAFPAYTHTNPLINWLFWERLRKTMEYIQRHAPYQRTLDFGCGSGVMLPFLCGVSQHVRALDVDLAPFKRMQAHLEFPANLEIQDARKVKLEDWPVGEFDLITALDVLEHVVDLEPTLTSLLRLLRPGGCFVISGPTENIFYRIGRRLSGPEYTGSYHERGILEVRRQLASRAQVEHIASLYWPMPLFEIFAARK